MIKDLYMAAILNNHQSLIMLIDFLMNEKKVLTLEDDSSKLEHYLQDKYKNKMNEFLEEYNLAKKFVAVASEMNVFQIRYSNTFFYVAAETMEQAENYFKEEYGNLHEIRVELPDLEVEGKDELLTLRHLIMQTKSFPAILGCWTVGGLENESTLSL